MTRRERVAWVALLVFAAVLRFAWLSERPPHHDESVHAHFADVLLRQGAYRYDPTYHGPLLFYVTAAIFAVAGESLLTLRLYPALAGIALVALPLVVRRRLGRRAAWWSGLILAISPSFLYYSRFAREDVPVALFTAAALALAWRVRDRGPAMLPWAGACLALHAISKESIYVTVPLLIAGGLLAVAVRRPREALAQAWRWVVRYRRSLATATLWFVAICLTAFTFVFIHPGDAIFPVKAVRYWYEQHRIQRVGGPWYYHFPRLGLYEFLPIAAALIWSARRWRRLHRWEAFCLGWGVSAVALFAYLGEKVPWLEVHQVLPFVPLAAAQLARTFSSQGRWWSRGLAVAALAGTAWSATAVTYLHPTITTSDPHAELLVFVQTTPEAAALAEQGRELAEQHPDETVLAVAGEASWPLSWQWRNLKVWWGLPQGAVRPQLVVCDPGQAAAVRAVIGAGAAEREIPLRGWWVETWRGVSLRQIAWWFLTRRAWSPIGATDVAVLESHQATVAPPQSGGGP